MGGLSFCLFSSWTLWLSTVLMGAGTARDQIDESRSLW